METAGDSLSLPGIELLGVIGRGGAADIFRAIRTEADGSKTPIAVKRLALDRSYPPMAIERFRREGRVARQLRHQNIIRVDDVVVSDTQLNIVMELLSGYSIADLRGGPHVSAAVALAVAVQVLEALHYAHSWCDEAGAGGLIHRDVTPGNLFICRDGIVKLLDFGIAKQSARERLDMTQVLTQEGLIVGTLEFLSPEQARRQRLDVRSDLFQLTASLYYLLSGTSPYGRGSQFELFQRGTRGQVQPLAIARPDLDPAVLAFFDRGLAATASDRFADAAEMLAAARALPTAALDNAGLGAWLEQAQRREPSNVSLDSQEVDDPAEDASIVTQASGSRRRGVPSSAGKGAVKPPGDAGPASAVTHAIKKAPTERAPGTRLGRYIILDCLGQGGMGVVYAAYDPDLARKVAVKLVRVRASRRKSTNEAQAHLLQEAQVMARVSHPNVISVFDVGTFEDRVFIAMELVEGGTLRSWLREAPRSWREVLKIMREAGNGLAAAHRAGLVHRDFKPDNVLVSTDGRVRVTDFGLARGADEGASSAPGTTDSIAAPSSLVTGTPAYMAPEQYLGQADPRSDQYSFCATLFEALYGRRLNELRTESDDLALPAAPQIPKDTQVPAWVGRIVLRGLSQEATERYASLDELVAALGRDPAAVRRRWLTWAALPMVALAASLAAQQIGQRQTQLCRAADQSLQGVWDGSIKTRGRSAFLAAGGPQADKIWTRAARVLDRYAADWIAMRTDSCEATRVRGDQSDEVMSLRMICLDQRMAALRAQTELLTKADAKMVSSALSAVQALPPLADCADVAALRAPVRLPSDPNARARIAATRDELARSLALYHSGKLRDALELADRASKEAQQLGYRPLMGEAMFGLGRMRDANGDFPGAILAYRAAMRNAQSGRDDATAAMSVANWGMVTGNRQGHMEEGYELTQDAMYMLDRLPGEAPVARSLVLVRAGVLASAIGHYDEAVRDLRRAAEIRKKTLGPNSLDLGRVLTLLGSVLGEQGAHLDQAVAAAKRGDELHIANLGDDHYEVLLADMNLAQVLFFKGDYAASERHARHAERIVEKLGPQHPVRRYVMAQLGDLAFAQGRLAEAEARLRETTQAFAKSGGDTTSQLTTLTSLARVLVAEHRPREAVAPLEQALAVSQKEHVAPCWVADAQFELAQVLSQVGGDRKRALELAEAARDNYRKHGPGREAQLLATEKWLGAQAAGAGPLARRAP